MGIAGCGMIAGGPGREGKAIAGNHAAACRAVPGVDLVAAADPDAARRAAFGAHWGIAKLSETVEDMLSDSSLDMLIVATPAEAHEHVCMAAIARGIKGILCEKPFTGSAAGARRVLDAARERGCSVAVNFTRRWDRSHRDLAERVARGELGHVREILACYTGTMRGNGAHFVDTLHMLTPGDWRVTWTSSLPRGADDGPIDAVLHRADGARAYVAAVRDAEYFVFESQVFGTKGRATLRFGGNDVRLDVPAPHPDYPGYRYLSEATQLPTMTLASALTSALETLCAAVRDGKEVDVAAEAHVASLAVVDSILKYATSTENRNE